MKKITLSSTTLCSITELALLLATIVSKKDDSDSIENRSFEYIREILFRRHDFCSLYRMNFLGSFKVGKGIKRKKVKLAHGRRRTRQTPPR